MYLHDQEHGSHSSPHNYHLKQKSKDRLPGTGIAATKKVDTAASFLVGMKHFRYEDGPRDVAIIIDSGYATGSSVCW